MFTSFFFVFHPKSQKTRVTCNFIDDEALEANDNDHEEESKEEEDAAEEEDNVEESDDNEGEFELLNDDEDDNENQNVDDNFNAGDEDDDDDNKNQVNLFESSSSDDESGMDKADKKFPDLFESSEDDASVNHVHHAASVNNAATLQTQTSNILTTTIMFDCPIITSFPRPSFSKDRIQEFKYNCDNAPCDRDSVITYETMGEDILLRHEPLESNGIKEVHSFVKEGRGLLWHNRTSVKLHYETSMSTYQDFVVPKAMKASIPHRLFHTDDTRLQRFVDGPNIFLFKSGSFDHFHEKVWFQELIRDACIHAPHTVPKMDTVRENSGPSVGLCTSQGLTRSRNESFAIPGWLAGTHRYMKVFDIISKTTKALLDSANLSDRLPNLASPKQKFYNQRCQDLSKENLYLSLSFKVYVHHPKNVQNHDSHFRAHRDRQNPDQDSPNDFMFCAWDTWFEPLLNLNVTGTIIACGRRHPSTQPQTL